MESEAYRWHYDYTRLAWESGFTFGNRKSRKAFDRNAIALIDIERIIRERDVAIVEKYFENILDYNLESDEIRILEPNFVKLFRLSQLSVEFLIYCKKYLDKTIVVLKDDLDKKSEENEFLQKEITKTMTENNKLKKKIKDLKMSLQYQHKFQRSLNDQLTIYQCNECSKNFINNEFLNAHLKRRHNILNDKMFENMQENISQESPDQTLHTSPEHEQYKTETDRLQSEIKELKEKLNNAERYFAPDIRNNGQSSPDHGAVKIQRIPMSIECINDVRGLQLQFELLKTMVESELITLKSQNKEHDMYDQWIQKIFDKLEPKMQIKNETNNDVEIKKKVYLNERRNSYAQTDEISDHLKENINLQIMQAKSESILRDNNNYSVHESSSKTRPSEQKLNGSASDLIIFDSATKNNEAIPNCTEIQDDTEKKLQEDARKEIAQLGDELRKKMSTSFNILEERMESFWNQFNEKQTAIISDISSPILAHIKKIKNNKSAENQPKKLEVVQIDSTFDKTKKGYIAGNIKLSTAESDSESEPESNRLISSYKEIQHPVSLVQGDINSQKFINELKNKVQECKFNSDTNMDSSDHDQTKPEMIYMESKEYKNDDIEVKQSKSNIKHVQKPVAKKVFSKPIIYSSTESETFSESESESNILEQYKNITPKTTPKKDKNMKSKEVPSQKGLFKKLEHRPTKSENSVHDVILEDVNKRLIDLGVDPLLKSLPNKVYKQKFELSEHQRNINIKKNQSFNTIREGILGHLEMKVKQLSHSSLQQYHPEVEEKSSKFKSLISSVKSRALVFMKLDKSPAKSTPLYKLTIQQDLPNEKNDKEIIPKHFSKERIPVKRDKIIIKPKKMYRETDDESESIKSDNVYIKRKTLQKNGESVPMTNRKSISVTSLNTDLSEKSIQNIGQSLSNLDSILELKKELVAEIKNENLEKKVKLKRVSSASETSSEESFLKAKPTTEYLQNQSENSDEERYKYKKDKVQKSVLKNYPSTSSLVKKKVLFDLESEVSKPKLNQSELQELQEPKKTIIKTNSFFDIDKDDDSTSATSSVFDGSRTNLNQLTKEKISTKAQINVPAKNVDKNYSESDFDISDLL